MLSATADHALRAVLFLAQQEERRVTSADDIADAIGAPRNYLSKTLNALTKAGITTSVAGRRGGFTLAVTPADLTLHRLISVFDAEPTSRRCLLGNRACAPEHPCAAHQRWMEIDRAADARLRSTTVADLLGA